MIKSLMIEGRFQSPAIEVGVNGIEMGIGIFGGVGAMALVHDQAFQEKWQKLYDKCPWGTVFQCESFISTWYESYQSQYTPLVVVGRGQDGELLGMLALAVDEATGELVVAGESQAEYQTWLADPRYSDMFIELALDELKQHFPNRALMFLFVPPSTPLQWASRKGGWGNSCFVRSLPRALMDIGDGTSFQKSLRKSSNRSRLNRLQKLGNLRFEHIVDPDGLESVFDEIMTYSRLRLANKVESTGNDPLKKDFYVNMMRKQGLLHATVMRVNESLVSAHIGVYNRNQVLLGIIAHSPFFARHSPGKLHLLMLGMELAKEGVPTFDLSPGGEYKERFATRHDRVHTLQVFFNRRHCARYKINREIISRGKAALEAVRIDPVKIKDAAIRARQKFSRLRARDIPWALLRRIKKLVYRQDEFRIYTYDVEKVRHLPAPKLMNRDDISDLLAYQPAESWQPPADKFLEEAVKNMEAGDHIYTRVEGGRLIHYGWLIDRQNKSFLSEVGQELFLLPESAVLTNFYTHPQARGRGLYQSSLRQMLHDAATIRGTKQIYIGVLANNSPSRHVIEKVGFTYQYSFYRRWILGRTRRWSNAPRAAITPPA